MLQHHSLVHSEQQASQCQLVFTKTLKMCLSEILQLSFNSPGCLAQDVFSGFGLFITRELSGKPTASSKSAHPRAGGVKH